jgi:hypothetical protein
MGVVLGGRGNTPMHPFLNDHAQRRFFLVFNGSEFTWANPKGVSNVLHTSPQMGTIGSVEAVIKWLKVTGVGRMSSRGRRGGRPFHSDRRHAAAHALPLYQLYKEQVALLRHSRRTLWPLLFQEAWMFAPYIEASWPHKGPNCGGREGCCGVVAHRCPIGT